ncbi:helix-turn-helix transcriptional regulator [Bosea sp. ANAM02]|uniref:helix-turn-helix transcriptional regulator n=1 Tax=Bosea sp. ANAM02 TaxID=2020412 RepID=UPI002467CFCA|nr:helix-turn-helix transcriptional regulator [Bosea sp. ANAM02]
MAPRSLVTRCSSEFEDRLPLLGRFEEVVLMACIACGPRATAQAIQQRLEARIGVQRNPTTMMTTLDRLSKKGLVDSTIESNSSARRGGRRRRLFDVTDSGRGSVEQSFGLISDMAQDAGLSDLRKNRAA